MENQAEGSEWVRGTSLAAQEAPLQPGEMALHLPHGPWWWALHQPHSWTGSVPALVFDDDLVTLLDREDATTHIQHLVGTWHTAHVREMCAPDLSLFRELGSASLTRRPWGCVLPER